MADFLMKPTEIGARIRALRKKQGKTQAYFADLLYISPSYLALIESGKRVPTLEVLVQIAVNCDVTIDYLVFGDKNTLDAEQIMFNRLRNSYSPVQIHHALQLAEYYLKLENPETAQPEDETP
ncbi:MAG: helix-turn-helix domain-containing protein [Roseburia sp.]